MGRGLYHHPARLAPEPGVQSLRVPISRSAFPADCPHLRIFTYTRTAYVSQDPRSSPHIARFVPVPCGSGVATQFTTYPSLLNLGSSAARTAPSPRLNSGGLTGGVCKEQGHIRPAVLTRDYHGIHMREGGLQNSVP